MMQPEFSALPADEEVAAIVAALAAYLDKEPASLRIAAVRRGESPVRSLWGLAGRQQQHSVGRMYQTGRSHR